MNGEPDKELEALSERLKSDPSARTPEAFRYLYDLIGKSLLTKNVGPSEENPCSVPAISNTVLTMAASLPPCRLLDVGMGGYPIVDAALTKMGHAVVGLEYSLPLVSMAHRYAQQHGVPLRIIAGDGARLPFRDCSFEAAVCSETVEHVPHPEIVIREIHRVLRPGGRLLFTVPCIIGALGFLGRIRHYRKKGTFVMHPTHLREYTYFSAKQLIQPYFNLRQWYPVPFVLAPFKKMPYENTLGKLTRIPPFRHFSLSIAFLLQKRKAPLCP